jgi:hypothetical protein
MRPYEPPDDLVITFANLAAASTQKPVSLELAEAARQVVADVFGGTDSPVKAEPTRREIAPVAMRTFLEKYGPLTNGDNDVWAGQFTTPAETIAEALEAASSGEAAKAFAIGLELLRETSRGELLGVLATQLLAQLFRGNVPKRCPGCGTFFIEANPETGKKFKRRDAKYCSYACGSKVRMKTRRERLRQQNNKTTKKGATDD